MTELVARAGRRFATETKLVTWGLRVVATSDDVFSR
jgi:hypothetical protein